MKIIYYLLACSLFANSFSAFCQSDSLALDLSEVSVTANLQGVDLKKTGRNVTVITAKQIQEAPVKSLDGILQYALNVDVRSRSPLGGQADISIRGGHYDQTLILVDGIKMNDPQTGHHSLNLPVPFSSIERIEVLQGGASRVFGPSAFSGVIHIITKKEQPTSLQVQAVAGQYGLRQLQGTGHLQTQNQTSLFALEGITQDGYMPNTAFDKWSAFAQTTLFTQNHRFTLQGGAMGNKFEAANFYHPMFNRQYEEVASRYFTGKWVWDVTPAFQSQLSFMQRTHTDMYDFDAYRFTNPSAVNYHETEVSELDWKGKWRWNAGVTTIGAAYRVESVLSNRLGEAREPIPVPGHFQQVYSKGLQRDNYSFFLEHLKTWDKWTVVGGTLFNVNSQFENAFYPGIDISYRWNERLNIYSSVNRSLRLPTFTELYLNTSTVKADPLLKPEAATSMEIGAKWNTPQFSLITSVFYKKTTNAIDKVKRPELPVPTMENIDDINLGGFEMAATWKLTEVLSSDSKWLPIVQMNYAYIFADRKEEGFQSFYTLNFLRNKASLGLTSQILPKWTVSAWFTWKDRMGSYQWNAASAPIPYEDVHLVDIRMQYMHKNTRLFADITNVLNQIYQEHGFVLQPGRWATLGVQWTIF